MVLITSVLLILHFRKMKKIPMALLPTGWEIEIRLSFLVFGNVFIILLLNPSNSRGLKEAGLNAFTLSPKKRTGSSRARKFHPHPLTEPWVKVSPHTALHTQRFVHMLLIKRIILRSRKQGSPHAHLMNSNPSQRIEKSQDRQGSGTIPWSSWLFEDRLINH